MNLLLTIGTRIVILALIAYTIAIGIEQKKRLVNKNVLIFLTMGLLLDITATIFMIAGSTNSPFTPHGFIGYSSLGAMLVDTLLIWKFYFINKDQPEVPTKLHLYSRFAYLWWVIAFITGGLLVFIK